MPEVIKLLDQVFKQVRGQVHSEFKDAVASLSDTQGTECAMEAVEASKSFFVGILVEAVRKRVGEVSYLSEGELEAAPVREHVFSCAERAVAFWSSDAFPNLPATSHDVGCRLARPHTQHPPHILRGSPGFGKGPTRSRRKRK